MTNDEIRKEANSSASSLIRLSSFGFRHSLSPAIMMQREPQEIFHIKFVAICWKLV
jgi:hypothetical protein